MIPTSQISTEHIRAAIEKIDSEGVPPHRASTKFEILFNSKKYPPKYVVGGDSGDSAGEENLDQPKNKRTHLTPTGLLMEGDYTHND